MVYNNDNYTEKELRVHFVSKRNAPTSSNQLQLFPGFERTRRSGGWSSWGLNLMNQYLGSSGGGWGQTHYPSQGSNGWAFNPAGNKASQVAALSKVIVTKAKLLRQMLELKRISANKFAEGLLYLNRLKGVPVSDHYQYYGAPAVAPVVANHGWQSGGSSGAVGGYVQGPGWGEDSKAASFKSLGYTIGSSLAGVSKFAKTVSNSYGDGQHWPTNGNSHTTTVVDYYPTEYSKSQLHTNHNPSGPERLKAYKTHTRPISNNGYGYNYGDGNEYSGLQSGWSDSPPNTNFGGGTTGGSGSGDSFVYEEGGNEITPGLRVPNFKPFTTKK